MRKILFAMLILALSGCACLRYEAPETKVTYCRFCTGSDTIRGALPNKATVEATGQKQLDPAVIELLLKALTAAGAL